LKAAPVVEEGAVERLAEALGLLALGVPLAPEAEAEVAGREVAGAEVPGAEVPGAEEGAGVPEAEPEAEPELETAAQACCWSCVAASN
jgi:hypothetical protein